MGKAITLSHMNAKRRKELATATPYTQNQTLTDEEKIRLIKEMENISLKDLRTFTPSKC